MAGVTQGCNRSPHLSLPKHTNRCILNQLFLCCSVMSLFSLLPWDVESRLSLNSKMFLVETISTIFYLWKIFCCFQLKLFTVRFVDYPIGTMFLERQISLEFLKCLFGHCILNSILFYWFWMTTEISAAEILTNLILTNITKHVCTVRWNYAWGQNMFLSCVEILWPIYKFAVSSADCKFSRHI